MEQYQYQYQYQRSRLTSLSLVLVGFFSSNSSSPLSSFFVFSSRMCSPLAWPLACALASAESSAMVENKAHWLWIPWTDRLDPYDRFSRHVADLWFKEVPYLPERAFVRTSPLNVIALLLIYATFLRSGRSSDSDDRMKWIVVSLVKRFHRTQNLTEPFYSERTLSINYVWRLT